MAGEKEKVLQYLDQLGVTYERLDHEPVYTVEQIEELNLWNHPDGAGAKNLFLRDGSGKHHYLVVIKEEKQANLNQVRDQIGCSRLSFASKERLAKYLKVEPGSVSPLGILNDDQLEVPVFFDQDLLKYEYIAVHPNDNSTTLWMHVKDLLEVIKHHGNTVTIIEV